MKTTLTTQAGNFETIKSEIEVALSRLNLKKLEAKVSQGFRDANVPDKDLIRVYIVPKGISEVSSTSNIQYSPDEQRELNLRLRDISLVLSKISEIYRFECSEFDKNLFDYTLRRRR